MAARSALAMLAERVGILSGYVDHGGTRRSASDEVRIALLAALGIDASSETAAAAALRRLEEEAESQIIEPVVVQRLGDRRARRLPVRLPPGVATADYHVSLHEESGAEHEDEGRLGRQGGARVSGIPLPRLRETGYHRLRLSLRWNGGESQREQLRILSPPRCLAVNDVLGKQRAFGLWSHLYTLRSQRAWGGGDFTDLQELMVWAREIGAAFVGINPLHALRNSGADISPYSPISRLYLNTLYLDIEAVPELPDSAETSALVDSAAYREALSGLRSARRLDYQRVMALKRPLIEALHRRFVELHRGRATSRGQAYALYLEREGESLDDFATFLTLSDRLANQHGRYWRSWPLVFRHPRSREVHEFRRAHFEEFDLHRYIQFELDRQLSAAASAAPLPVGVYGDLAIGSASDGSDTWAFPNLFVQDAKLGAPPDDYSLEGQDWGLPPLNPHRLRADQYRYWIKLLRGGLRHFGALRIDHVMGLLRQYWVPAGQPATRGAYISFPHQELFGILALESHRHGAVIVGEDLGTVPAGFSSVLARWGILSTRLLYFERDRLGRFRPASRYSKRALVTANSHDNPPLLGWWEGRDIELRRAAGSLAGERERADAERQRAQDRAALQQRLATEGCVSPSTTSGIVEDLVEAVHEFLARTPAPLVGLAVDDLAGERDPINLPGVQGDKYPSWTRRIGMQIETLRRDNRTRQALRRLSAVRTEGKPARSGKRQP